MDNRHPIGSIEHAKQEAQQRSALYRITCYVVRLAEHYADEHGVYGWYSYDAPPLDDTYLTAIYRNGELIQEASNH